MALANDEVAEISKRNPQTLLNNPFQPSNSLPHREYCTLLALSDLKGSIFDSTAGCHRLSHGSGLLSEAMVSTEHNAPRCRSRPSKHSLTTTAMRIPNSIQHCQLLIIRGGLFDPHQRASSESVPHPHIDVLARFGLSSARIHCVLESKNLELGMQTRQSAPTIVGATVSVC